MVEQGVFPKKAVKDLLVSNFVEARLNTDLDASHPNYKFDAQIQKLREELLGKGNLGLPQYFVVDPRDIGSPLAKRSGSAGVDTFVKFFEKGIAAAQKGGG